MTGPRVNWKRIAGELASRMEVHAYCEAHPVSEPDLQGCPFCQDRAAYLRWCAASGKGPRRTVIDDARSVPLRDLREE